MIFLKLSWHGMTMPLTNALTLLMGLWYIVFAVTQTDGPFNLFAGLKGLPYTIGKLFQCSICLSLWVSLGLFGIYQQWGIEWIYPIALAGVLVLIWQVHDVFHSWWRDRVLQDRLARLPEIRDMLLDNEVLAEYVDEICVAYIGTTQSLEDILLETKGQLADA